MLYYTIPWLPGVRRPHVQPRSRAPSKRPRPGDLNKNKLPGTVFHTCVLLSKRNGLWVWVSFVVLRSVAHGERPVCAAARERSGL